MIKENKLSKIRVTIGPIRWCQYIVIAGYLTVGAMTLAHVVWYFAARRILAWPAEIYLWHYIIYPTIGFVLLTVTADLLTRSNRVQLIVKEYISLSLFLIFSLYLCLTHRIASVLLASYTLTIFASCIFANVRITRWSFGMSSIALLLTGVKLYFEGDLDKDMIMQIFVAYYILLSSYFLARALIRSGNDSLMMLIEYQNRQNSMEEQLKLDSFTGLYNKKTFDEWLPQLMEECKNSNKCLSLAMLDVDKFKRINDVYGHMAGDKALLRLAHILESNKNENIYVFRIGGDEFAIIFKDYCVKEAYKVCDGMRSMMGSSMHHDADKIHVTISCGLACMNLKYTSSIELIKAADSALYKAKNNDRNKVVISEGAGECVNQVRN
ncbi:GGDEF domain-containing protein [Lacrimispora sp.]|uniref:GGDEF domain-containing protein n=1 Tax=Lacrimispora sp. TaxID=2719234 RepID=UPI0028A8E255|nr:GGDEF domain-containing protein [Lacrimispora sp.]